MKNIIFILLMLTLNGCTANATKTTNSTNTTNATDATNATNATNTTGATGATGATKTTDATNITKVLISTIMAECDAGNNKENFSFYVSCIKSDYAHFSNDTSYDSVTKMFYTQLDVIDENYRQSKITNEKAKAAAYRTWQETFDEGKQNETKRTPEK